MSKNKILIVTGVAVALAVGGTTYALSHNQTTVALAPHFWAQAKATKADTACVGANSKITISKSTRDDIEMRAVSYLADVPAGTNVDVQLASYSSTAVTGSDRYPAKYGSYNFAMTKQNDGWHFTAFTHCH